ncbi:hypothetical protein H6G17_28455 [Chroococcidiopsis sp. FACHB-1243]|uniref:hypothetical protein n=1 Tax=Chroococcidiopsis sp. [FACHB-1243] TaxID=2692781 RepID=UPI00177B9C7B|nr:hypothetical protein [Chroococcidiopsis sp. [FACHB-1243]]MBD2309389.1 hypothetical protein [Chroococcidiopsis sp. [FACHB-1243]]
MQQKLDLEAGVRISVLSFSIAFWAIGSGMKSRARSREQYLHEQKTLARHHSTLGAIRL